MFTRSGFEKPSDTPVPPRRTMGGGDESKPGATAAPTSQASVNFTAKQFDQLIKTFKESTVQAANSNATMQRALEAIQQQQQPAAAAAAPPPDKKKIPQFWEAKPVAWFRIFEREMLNRSQAAKFDLMLPYLTSSALAHIDALVDAPSDTPFTEAKEKLLLRFKRCKYEMANELLSLRSLGDRKPSVMLAHMRSLQPGEAEATIFKVIFLNMLPRNARDAAIKHEDLDDMAAAADLVLAIPDTPAGQALGISSVQDDEDDHVLAVDAVQRPSPRSSERLCQIHSRFGREAYRCTNPSRCDMWNVIRAKPRRPASSSVKSDSTPASGNGKAGRQ